MITQLPNGRIIECSIEQYLSFSDQEIRELNGLGSAYTKEVVDPFYNKFSSNSNKPDPEVTYSIDENEPALDEIEPFDKYEDPYFHPDDT